MSMVDCDFVERITLKVLIDRLEKYGLSYQEQLSDLEYLLNFVIVYAFSGGDAKNSGVDQIRTLYDESVEDAAVFYAELFHNLRKLLRPVVEGDFNMQQIDGFKSLKKSAEKMDEYVDFFESVMQSKDTSHDLSDLRKLRRQMSYADSSF